MFVYMDPDCKIVISIQYVAFAYRPNKLYFQKRLIFLYFMLVLARVGTICSGKIVKYIGRYVYNKDVFIEATEDATGTMCRIPPAHITI